MSIIFALIIFGVIVTFHEFGHFIVAKKSGIKVIEFSVGMGPRILSRQGKETRYSLKLLPLGGSCMMLGEDEDEESVEEVLTQCLCQSDWLQFLQDRCLILFWPFLWR